MKKAFNILILTFIIFLISCDIRPSALGLQQRIFVFADSLLWQEIGADVEETFNDYIYTPRAERSFNVSWEPLRNLKGLQNRMNILFIGTTDQKNLVNDYLLNSIPPEFVESVKEDRSFYFFKDDLFARDQISLFMLAKDSSSFKKNFEQLKINILDQFKTKYYSRLKQGMYEKGEQFGVEEFLTEEYGYKVRVQHDYFLANQSPEEKYIWLRRLDPDRWLSIWQADSSTDTFSYHSLISYRNRMTAKYYDGDYIVEKETKLDTVQFRGAPTIKMTGTWRNDSVLVGGPFRMYVVKNPEENKNYFIDIAVMAPDKSKKPFLDQLEVIASTFQFVNSDTVKN